MQVFRYLEKYILYTSTVLQLVTNIVKSYLFLRSRDRLLVGCSHILSVNFKKSQRIELHVLKSMIFHDVNNLRIHVNVCDWLKKKPNYMYFLWYIYLFCRKIRLLVNNTDVLYHRFVRYYIYMHIYCNWNRRGIHCIVCWPQRLFTYVYLYEYGRIISHASQVKNITDNHFSKILLSSFMKWQIRK